MSPLAGRTWALSALLFAVGVVYLLVLEDPLTAVAFVVAGALVPLAVPTRRPVANTRGVVSDAGLAGLVDVVHGFGLDAAGIHVPTEDGVRLFIPADPEVTQRDLPRLGAETTLVRSRPGAFGLALTPPGAGLLADWRAENPLKSGSPEAVAAALRRALPELGLGTDVRVETGGGRLRIQYRHLAYEPLCRRTREEWAPWHLQGGCPACSFVAAVSAEATETPLRFAKVEGAGETVSIVLEPLPREPPTRKERAAAKARPVPVAA